MLSHVELSSSLLFRKAVRGVVGGDWCGWPSRDCPAGGNMITLNYKIIIFCSQQNLSIKIQYAFVIFRVYNFC
jgi:hypothetical protein